MKTTIKTDKAPASTSPVAQGTKGGGLVFVGGQMPMDMKSGQIVDGRWNKLGFHKHCGTILNGGRNNS